MQINGAGESGRFISRKYERPYDPYGKEAARRGRLAEEYAANLREEDVGTIPADVTTPGGRGVASSKDTVNVHLTGDFSLLDSFGKVVGEVARMNAEIRKPGIGW